MGHQIYPKALYIRPRMFSFYDVFSDSSPIDKPDQAGFLHTKKRQILVASERFRLPIFGC